MSDPLSADPFLQFTEWMAAAVRARVPEPTAMSLATTGANGDPQVRMLLLKHFDERGFVFYTNLESPKAAELIANPRAALCFYWNKLGRQVRATGAVERVTDAEADAYFATRPRLSQLGAWASRQSRPMTDRFELERNCAAMAMRFGLGMIPRPPGWSGFRLVPGMIEFWREQPFRRHERIRFVRRDGVWSAAWLFP
jgi:pyridoxamine 5'-phosphate oxidase